MTFRVQQQVARLHVPMQQIGGVQILEALEILVDYILLVDVFQDVSPNHSVQVRVHEVEHQVDVAIIFSSNYILQPDYVLMAGQLLKENDLAECSLGVSCVLEGVEVFLERNDFFGTFVDSLPDNTVRTFAQFLEYFVFS